MCVYMYKYNLLSPYNVTCVYMISEHLFVPGSFIDTKKKGDEHLLEKCISHADGVTADNYKEIGFLSQVRKTRCHFRVTVQETINCAL